MTTCYHCLELVNGIDGHKPTCPVPELIVTVLANKPDVVTIVEDLLKVIDMLMPGIGSIAVEDYALVNDAPLQARRWLAARGYERQG